MTTFEHVAAAITLQNGVNIPRYRVKIQPLRLGQVGKTAIRDQFNGVTGLFQPHPQRDKRLYVAA
ncbi:MAG: hypothetical protein V9G20_31370 [Candidatus Promineifilaceae bacterium]